MLEFFLAADRAISVKSETLPIESGVGKTADSSGVNEIDCEPSLPIENNVDMAIDLCVATDSGVASLLTTASILTSETVATDSGVATLLTAVLTMQVLLGQTRMR
jgi:hypothetical protein